MAGSRKFSGRPNAIRRKPLTGWRKESISAEFFDPHGAEKESPCRSGHLALPLAAGTRATARG
jgi:hypothetical protein